MKCFLMNDVNLEKRGTWTLTRSSVLSVCHKRTHTEAASGNKRLADFEVYGKSAKREQEFRSIT